MNLINARLKASLEILKIDEKCEFQESIPAFGDYQCNIISVAKKLKISPIALAESILKAIKIDDIANISIAGAGFINIKLHDETLIQFINQEEKQDAKTVVIDYSSPNLAKEMHVGHLRSTLIGDSLVRIYEYLGHKVIRQNHAGDWGLQFGMILAFIDDEKQEFTLNEIEKIYVSAKHRFDNDEEFAEKARNYVVKLQNGDIKTKKLWEKIVSLSLTACQNIYDILGVKLQPSDIVGESYYQPYLSKLVKKLLDSGLAKFSDSAVCIFTELDENPLIIKKQDGGYLYATTDLAAVEHRVSNLHADKVLYVVDNRQSLYLKQMFLASSSVIATDTKLDHVGFGMMLNENGKPFKTRDGGTVKLLDFINTAIEMAEKMLLQRNNEMENITAIAKHIAIASIKYSDISKNRLTDYQFYLDRMLSFDGNTAPYLLYSYTRIYNIFVKSNVNINTVNLPNNIFDDFEREVALTVMRFYPTVEKSANDNYPHYIANYVYKLATSLMQFYENCNILNEQDNDIKQNRLSIAAIGANTMKKALYLIGIDVLNKM